MGEAAGGGGCCADVNSFTIMRRQHRTASLSRPPGLPPVSYRHRLAAHPHNARLLLHTTDIVIIIIIITDMFRVA